MGGQFDYFGLWLDHDYGHGHSRGEPHCSTFRSPQLAGKENFQIELLEIWGLGPDPATLLTEEDPVSFKF